ncbi:LOG family protein [Pseudomonas sp. T8]|uniref:LOG family protein n=1 Tax=Pseudomonas sp. T8 TaxID=645292 RepID=UPI0021485117|nr:LOG family protein [Pseudomonas sp. T8]UUT22429.1 LOG family protein [Pseudomonas sp. T8]
MSFKKRVTTTFPRRPTAVILSLTGFIFSLQPAHGDIACTPIAGAYYAGPYKGVDNNLSSEDMYQDIYCANRFKSEKYVNGFITIYGSSRIIENNNQTDKKIKEENDKLYKEIKELSFKWTKLYSSIYPIMTGAGPGLMEAGSRGAHEAGGPSIGYTTYYGKSRDGDPKKAFQTYDDPATSTDEQRRIITDGLIFSSVAIREYSMILHSAAIIIAPGGTGTEWETFQILESIKSDQLKPVPIYLVGDKNTHWKSFYDRLEDMISRGTFRRHEAYANFVHVDNPLDVLALLEKKLNVK